MDELTQWHTPFAWNYLRSRLRSTAPDLPIYMRATTNPGGAGHNWVKKMFIDPANFGEAFDATDIDSGETLRYPVGHSKEGQALFKRRFIPKLADNPFLSKQVTMRPTFSRYQSIREDSYWRVAGILQGCSLH